jgi:urea transporter
MIVAIIARTILEDMSHGSGKLAFFSNALIGLLWVLALIAFSFYAALYGQFIAGNAPQITNDGSKYTTVFYSAYIFGISMYLAILACVAVFKRPSKVYSPHLFCRRVYN